MGGWSCLYSTAIWHNCTFESHFISQHCLKRATTALLREKWKIDFADGLRVFTGGCEGKEYIFGLLRHSTLWVPSLLACWSVLRRFTFKVGHWEGNEYPQYLCQYRLSEVGYLFGIWTRRQHVGFGQLETGFRFQDMWMVFWLHLRSELGFNFTCVPKVFHLISLPWCTQYSTKEPYLS